MLINQPVNHVTIRFVSDFLGAKPIARVGLNWDGCCSHSGYISITQALNTLRIHNSLVEIEQWTIRNGATMRMRWCA